MATSKTRVAAYLPSHIEERFNAFKAKKGLDNDSKAIIHILASFFGVAQSTGFEVAHSGQYATVERVEALEAQISELLKLIGESQNKIIEDAVSDVKSDLRSEPLNVLPGHGQTALFDEPEPSPGIRFDLSKGLSMRALEKRWPASRKTISQMLKEMTVEEFRAWSAQQDPDGIPWEQMEGRLYPSL